MINFEIVSTEIGYISIKLSLRTIKTTELGEINRKLNFYIVINQRYILLDTTNFYTLSLPTNKIYTDNLLINGEVVSFRFTDPLLIAGAYGSIVALDSLSSTIKYQSTPIFLKTKTISQPQFSVKNSFFDKFKSSITLSMSEIDEPTIVENHYLIQYIQNNGIGNPTIAISGSQTLSSNTIDIEYATVNQFGSYKIITKIFNSVGDVIAANVSYYENHVEPLPIIVKHADVAADNFFPCEVVKAYYKKSNVAYRITKIIVKL